MKKQIYSRLLALLLCGCLLAAGVLGCGRDAGEDIATITTENAGGEAVTTTETVVTTDSHLDANGFLKDDIPDDFNGNGQKISVLVYKEAKNWLFPEENSDTDMIFSGVFMRNVGIEDRLGITFEPVYCNAAYSEKNTYITKATLAGESNYDLLCSYSLWPSVLATKGVLFNLNNLEYPHFDQPWWPKSLDSWEQMGTLFFCAGNSSARLISETEVTFANSEMLANVGAEDPITLVLDGTWTLDKLYEMSSLFHSDMNEGEVYGLVVDDQSRLDAYYYGSGFNCTRNGPDGVAHMAFMEDKEAISGLIDKMISLYQRSEAKIDTSTNLMYQYKTAFMTCGMFEVTHLDDTTIYMALPMPKLNEDQKEYKTVPTNGYEVWCVPVTAKNPELSGVVMEAVASADYREMAPLYYEQYLKTRYSTSDLGFEVFDIIRNSVIFDFGRISAESLGVTEALFRNAVKNFNNQYASQLAGQNKIYEKQLSNILKVYEELNQR